MFEYSINLNVRLMLDFNQFTIIICGQFYVKEAGKDADIWQLE